jgi:hypothetical protein
VNEISLRILEKREERTVPEVFGSCLGRWRQLGILMRSWRNFARKFTKRVFICKVENSSCEI